MHIEIYIMFSLLLKGKDPERRKHHKETDVTASLTSSWVSSSGSIIYTKVSSSNIPLQREKPHKEKINNYSKQQEIAGSCILHL